MMRVQFIREAATGGWRVARSRGPFFAVQTLGEESNLRWQPPNQIDMSLNQYTGTARGFSSQSLLIAAGQVKRDSDVEWAATPPPLISTFA